jgi:hypothetical protein
MNIQLTNSAQTVVNNLIAIDPRLAAYAPWRIAYAHSHYSTSEDHGDDLKVIEWLPDDDEKHRMEYRDMQMDELRRTIYELERYNLDLRKQIKTLNTKIDELS